MKKFWGIASLLFALVIALSACSGSSGNGSGNKKELTAWAWNVNVPVLKEAAKEFAKNNPGFKLNITEMGNNDVYQKLTTGLQAGGQGLPDIVLVEDDHIQGYLNAFPKAFVNVSDKGFDSEKSKFPSYKTDLLTKDGKMYGFPFDGGPTGVFYRTDYFKKAGIDPNSIKTWDDFINAGKTIKQKLGVDLVGLDLNGDDGLYRIMLNQQGDFYFDKSGNIDFTSDASKKAMEVQKKLKDAGLVKNTSGWDAWIGAISQGKVAAVPTGAWLAGSLEQQAANLKGKWGVFPMPAFTADGNHAANSGGSDYTILSNSKNVDLAYKFLKFFSTSNDVQLTAMKGGLLPSLNTVYGDKMFTSPDPYFASQPIWKLFSDEMKNIPSVNYTTNYAVAKDEAVKAQSQIANGTDITKALEDAKSRLENRISK
ncbi:ABC transporter substrate-binding protein [Heyndrickxia acidicola]|uniref:Sugar ABC transporter substrate-binding protein n=1 Tax=Heyndrickxia acidicola TaxID=209389 RepID=A0ABU6MFE6_9BACI|nr:sugar ABC transporter substrate-binding protein [Heyndrickxia acidicola]MED1203386.1 sugar ABC transporter substrate-binding protein [Heyndrickxia acidicola]